MTDKRIRLALTSRLFGALFDALLIAVALLALVRCWRRGSLAKTQVRSIVRRKLPIPQIFVDANCINALQRIQDVNQLEEWDARGVISLRLPEQAQSEVEAAGSKQRRKAMNRLVPQAYITTDDEKKALIAIEDIISPTRPLTKSDAGDAMNVFIAWKYSRAILVTSDRALLQKAAALQSAMGAQVMKPSDVVELIRRSIIARDRAATNEARCRGFALPEWVGQD